jgi:hypothetical protein
LIVIISFSAAEMLTMNSLHMSRSIAAQIRDVLVQHADIFAAVGPGEIRGQLIARLAGDGSAIESYLSELEQTLDRYLAIIPSRGSLVGDPANQRTFRGHSGVLNHVVVLDRARSLSASDDCTLRLWDLIARREGRAFPPSYTPDRLLS